MTQDDADDTRTEAERIKDDFRRDGQWHTTNSAELPNHRGLLLELVEKWEGQERSRAAEAAEARRVLDEARAKWQRAEAERSNAALNAKIAKMALAEQMEIPQ